MRDVTNGIKILSAIIALSVVSTGCSHPTASGNGGGNGAAYMTMPPKQAESQFLSDIAALPAGERDDYVQAHLDVLDILKMDPDKSKLNELNSLMPPKQP